MTDATTTRTVLCVDDSEGHLKILELSLSAHGYRVALAENGHDALTMLQSMTPDLMIVDVDMPFLDGFALTERVRRLRRFDDVPIVIMTAAERPELPERVAAAGADLLIRKPVQGKNLARLVGDLLGAGRGATADVARRP
jgi:chemosensory pili system protein ChpA (sensor histidine kinase/response regulator)